MASAKYQMYLKSAEWAAIKTLVKERAGNDNGGVIACERCKSERGSFEVHHLTYSNIYNERLSDLLLVCRNCHQYFTHCQRSFKVPEPYPSWGDVEKWCCPSNAHTNEMDEIRTLLSEHAGAMSLI
jgi:hypothetical protein